MLCNLPDASPELLVKFHIRGPHSSSSESESPGEGPVIIGGLRGFLSGELGNKIVMNFRENG